MCDVTHSYGTWRTCITHTPAWRRCANDWLSAESRSPRALRVLPWDDAVVWRIHMSHDSIICDMILSHGLLVFFIETTLWRDTFTCKKSKLHVMWVWVTVTSCALCACLRWHCELPNSSVTWLDHMWRNYKMVTVTQSHVTRNWILSHVTYDWVMSHVTWLWSYVMQLWVTVTSCAACTC